jgi:drug/metabolite transporter (DMT)-like permease
LTSLALGLVLISALVHATWNLLAKRSGGGRLFIWSFTTLSSLFLVPAALVLIVVGEHEITMTRFLFASGTALLHLAYFVCLQRGYQTGDLSLVYPLARGLGPALSMVGAITILGERPSWLAILGLLLIVTGIVVLATHSTSKVARPRAAIFYGVLTGTLIATYTVWDKYTIHVLLVPPLVLEAFCGMGISLMLLPVAIREWTAVKQIWHDNKTEVIGVAILAPASYIMILTAMSFTPLSYVAPCREISILFAAILAARFLNEGNTTRRIVAACVMVAGVIALTLG